MNAVDRDALSVSGFCFVFKKLDLHNSRPLWRNIFVITDFAMHSTDRKIRAVACVLF